MKCKSSLRTEREEEEEAAGRRKGARRKEVRKPTQPRGLRDMTGHRTIGSSTAYDMRASYYWRKHEGKKDRHCISSSLSRAKAHKMSKSFTGC